MATSGSRERVVKKVGRSDPGALLEELATRGAQAVATPHLGNAIESFEGLIALAESFLVRERVPDVFPPTR